MVKNLNPDEECFRLTVEPASHLNDDEVEWNIDMDILE